jgi:hypothetical protein
MVPKVISKTMPHAARSRSHLQDAKAAKEKALEIANLNELALKNSGQLYLL